MYWYPGGSAGASTTCIDEEGEWESHRSDNASAALSPEHISYEHQSLEPDVVLVYRIISGSYCNHFASLCPCDAAVGQKVRICVV